MPRRVKVAIANEDVSDDNRASSDGSDLEDEPFEVAEHNTGAGTSTHPPRRQKISISMKTSQKKGEPCKVCGRTDHQAGFRGATYVDCPNKPCYLCKTEGHTTATCPHRLNPGHGCSSVIDTRDLVSAMVEREREGAWSGVKLDYPAKWKIGSAIFKLHSRRCTCLEFHPRKDDIVVSGDKSGQLAVWNFKDVAEHTVFDRHHHANVNVVRFMGDGDGMTCFTTSADGLLKATDIEVGAGKDLLNMNPGGWVHGVSNERNWGMLNGLAVNNDKGLIVAGDSFGEVHFVDYRAKDVILGAKLHKAKVTSCDFNPVEPGLLLTSGNDHNARLTDIRMVSKDKDESSELCAMPHKRVVTSAYFSPLSGRKLMTTCIDNRIRVWDDMCNCDGDPSREIVHSHDFNRHLTPFRAEWDPKDISESSIVIGRYISENFDGQALHPVDVFNVGNGNLRAEMIDPIMHTISPVNKFHPRLDLIISGSSRALFIWKPVIEGEEENGKGDDDGLDKMGNKGFTFFDVDKEKKQQQKKRKAES